MIRSLLESNNTFASTVILYLIDKYGMDALSFEPETVAESLLAVNPNTRRQIIDRTNAGLGLFSSDLFWTDPFVFGTVCRSLSFHKFPTASAPTLLDLAWGVNEAKLLTLDPDTGDKLSEFGDSVGRFVEVTAKAENTTTLPDALSDIVKIESLFNVDDMELISARQAESDAKAAEIDDIVNKRTLELFRQIKSLKLNITSAAAAELDDILGVSK